jgi:hypothetical protein
MTPLATRLLAERLRAGRREGTGCGDHARHSFTAAWRRQIINGSACTSPRHRKRSNLGYRDRGFARFAGLKLFDPASA